MGLLHMVLPFLTVFVLARTRRFSSRYAHANPAAQFTLRFAHQVCPGRHCIARAHGQAPGHAGARLLGPDEEAIGVSVNVLIGSDQKKKRLWCIALAPKQR